MGLLQEEVMSLNDIPSAGWRWERGQVGLVFLAGFMVFGGVAVLVGVVGLGYLLRGVLLGEWERLRREYEF